MKVTQIEKLNQLISRTDMTGNQKVDWLTNFIDEHVTEQLRLHDVSHRFSKEDLWDAWWASAIKTISFSGVDKDYERKCFEKFYENKLASLNGG